MALATGWRAVFSALAGSAAFSRAILTLPHKSGLFFIPSPGFFTALCVSKRSERSFFNSLLGHPPGQDLQPDRSDTLNLETIHSNLDDIATRGLAPSFELNLGRGKSLPATWQAKVTLWTSVPDTDDTYAIVPRDRWELGDDHTKILPSTNPEREDDDDANPGWKLPWRIALIELVPSFGVLLLFVSWIVKSG